jgi:hypothetical protein
LLYNFSFTGLTISSLFFYGLLSMFLWLVLLEARGMSGSATILRELDGDNFVVDGSSVVVANGSCRVAFVLVDQGDSAKILTKLIHVEVAVEEGTAL